MKKTGYYFMHRGWRDNPIFGDDEYTRADAWCWLIENATHKDIKIDVNGIACKLLAGQMMHSVRHLAECWNWTRSKAQRYLDLLEKEGMISRSMSCIAIQGSDTATDTAIDTPWMVITLCKYVKYQDGLRATDTGVDTARDTGQRDNNKKNMDLVNNNTLPETSRSSREIFLNVVHLAGMNNIPKDEHLLQQWLDLGAFVEDEINPVIRSIRDRLLQQTGKAPFTLKVFDAEIRQRVHDRKRSDEVRKMSNDRAAREIAEGEEHHRILQAKIKRSEEAWEEYWIKHPDERPVVTVQ